jgi:hypothetical protein
VDRETARANLKAGIKAAGVAVFVFGMTFVAAILYLPA